MHLCVLTQIVPEPNNLNTTFIEFPSFPRMAQSEFFIAMRGMHEPVWKYEVEEGVETRSGTTVRLICLCIEIFGSAQP